MEFPINNNKHHSKYLLSVEMHDAGIHHQIRMNRKPKQVNESVYENKQIWQYLSTTHTQNISGNTNL